MNPQAGLSPQGERFRWAVDFSITGDLRYLSHRDVIRLFGRALARAALPVRFSQGFNPRPRMSFPLPRPVGVASKVERLVLELSQAVVPDALRRRLAEQMPDGLDIKTAVPIALAQRCRPAGVVYQAALLPVEMTGLAGEVLSFLSQTQVWHERRDPEQKTSRRVNVRPFVRHLDVNSEGLRMDFYVCGEGTARPNEVCAALGLTDEGINSRILRTEIQWS